MTQNLKSRTYAFLFLTLLGSFAVLSVGLNRSLVGIAGKVRIAETPDSAKSASFRWHPELYRLLSFGHTPAAVDWLLIRFLVDANLTKIKNDQETEVFRILNLATELDPAFLSLYTGGANFLAVARDDRVGALKLVEKGERFLRQSLPSYSAHFREEYWPNAWRIFMIKGYLYLMEFRDAGKAAAAYAQMGEFPDAPQGVQIMAKSNQSPQAQFNLAANSLKQLRQIYANDAAFMRDIDQREKYLLTAKDIVIWNEQFRASLGGKRPTAAAFAGFREKTGIPARDRLGGEIFLNPRGYIDTKSEKVPVLGTDLEATLRGDRPGSR